MVDSLARKLRANSNPMVVKSLCMYLRVEQ